MKSLFTLTKESPPCTSTLCPGISEKKGVLMNEADDDSVIENINPATFQKLVAEGVIQGGMIPKLENSFEALKSGVKQVVITRADLIKMKNTCTTIKL